MWNCPHCGCQAIAASLTFCPMCFKTKESDMPKVSLGGPTNADAAPGEVGYINLDEPTAPEPVVEPVVEVPVPVVAPEPAQPVVAPEPPPEPTPEPVVVPEVVVPAPVAPGPEPAPVVVD